jgi:hypothetical protein
MNRRAVLGALGATAVGIAAVGAAGAAEKAEDAKDSQLYLVEFEATEAGAPTSRDQAITLLDQLIVPSLENLGKDGRIRAGGLLVGARAGVFVVGAKSHDEVTELVRALPAWGVWHWKVTPLDSFAHRADVEKKAVQKLRAAAPDRGTRP